MSDADAVVLHIRAGELLGDREWVYVWLRGDGVVYAGATTLHPAARTWLHLHSPDPDAGRVAALLPDVAAQALDVLAFPVPAGTARQELKAALVDRLAAARLLSPSYVGPGARHPGDAETAAAADALAAAVARHLAHGEG